MVKEYKFGQMVLFMKVTGRKGKRMDEVDWSMLKGTFTKEIGWKEKFRGMVIISIEMVLSTKENGFKINITGWARNHGLMVDFSMAILNLEWNMVMENFIGQTDLHIKDYLNKTV